MLALMLVHDVLYLEENYSSVTYGSSETELIYDTTAFSLWWIVNLHPQASFNDDTGFYGEMDAPPDGVENLEDYEVAEVFDQFGEDLNDPRWKQLDINHKGDTDNVYLRGLRPESSQYIFDEQMNLVNSDNPASYDEAQETLWDYLSAITATLTQPEEYSRSLEPDSVIYRCTSSTQNWWKHGTEISYPFINDMSAREIVMYIQRGKNEVVAAYNSWTLSDVDNIIEAYATSFGEGIRDLRDDESISVWSDDGLVSILKNQNNFEGENFHDWVHRKKDLDNLGTTITPGPGRNRNLTQDFENEKWVTEWMGEGLEYLLLPFVEDELWLYFYDQHQNYLDAPNFITPLGQVEVLSLSDDKMVGEGRDYMYHFMFSPVQDISITGDVFVERGYVNPDFSSLRSKKTMPYKSSDSILHEGEDVKNENNETIKYMNQRIGPEWETTLFTENDFLKKPNWDNYATGDDWRFPEENDLMLIINKGAFFKKGTTYIMGPDGIVSDDQSVFKDGSVHQQAYYLEPSGDIENIGYENGLWNFEMSDSRIDTNKDRVEDAEQLNPQDFP